MTSLGMSAYFIGYSLACLLACRSKIVGVGSQPISSCMHAFEFQSMKTKNEKEKRRRRRRLRFCTCRRCMTHPAQTESSIPSKPLYCILYFAYCIYDHDVDES